MNKIIISIFTITAILFSSVSAFSAELPDYFKGKVIAEGKKIEWTPDGQGVSYSSDDGIYIYNLQTRKSEKLAEMFAAEYIWLNNDSILAIEWPDNVRDRDKVSKIVKYWIIERSGEKNLIAADTSITNRIPDYNRPFMLSQGTVALMKNAGWRIKGFPQNENVIAFAPSDYNLEDALDHYFYTSWSDQEGGSIHFKNIEKETIRTLALDKDLYDPDLSPDRSKMFVYLDNSAVILDTNANPLANLGNTISLSSGDKLKKFFGAVWDSKSDKIVFYEIYDKPEDYKAICYYDLNTGRKTFLTQSPYYGGDDLRFSPDSKLLAVHLVYNGTDYIALIDVPEPEEDAQY